MTNEPSTGRDSERTGPLATDVAVQDRLRGITARRIGLTIAVAWVSFAVLHVLAHRPYVTGVHITTGTICFVANVFSARRPVVALYATGVSSLIGLVLVAAMTGGPTAPAMTFLGLVPLLVGLLEERSHRLAWLVVSLTALVTVALLRGALPDESNVLSSVEYYVGPFGLGVLVFVIGTVWRRSSSEQLELLERRRDKIARQADALAAQRVELDAARVAAERASAAKSRFVAMTAHELRGPLNGVLGMAHVLSETKLAGGQADLVGSIRTSAEGLNKVLQDLLDLSKIEAGKLDITVGGYEPRELCADVLDTYAGAAADKGLAIGWMAAAAVPPFCVDDAGRLRQVLSNLVANAVKFTNAGEVRIEVDLVADRLVYAVKDTGQGIAPEHVERIFAPFEQVSDALLDRRAGTGLGLWIARSFVDAMGGRLRVESTPKRGSAFYVELPCETPDSPPEQRVTLPGRPHWIVEARTAIERDTARSVAYQLETEVTVVDGLDAVRGAVRPDTHLVIVEAERVAALRQLGLPSHVHLALAAPGRQVGAAEALVPALGRPATVVLKPLRASRVASLLVPNVQNDGTPAPITPEDVVGILLVVDDDAINRKVARFGATRFGYQVVEAASGEEALEILGRRPVDVVLLDLHMEGMDGAQTALAIAERFAPAMRPSLLAHTGTVNETDRARCLAAGMEEILTKPLEQSELGAALARARRLRARRRLSGSIASLDALPVLHDETLTKFLTAMEAEGMELARTFARELPARVRRLQAAHHTQNRAALKREAHTLASAAATFGGARLTLSCRRIESNADAEAMPMLEARVLEVEARANELRPVLERALSGR